MSFDAEASLSKLFKSEKLFSKLVTFEKIQFDSESDAALIISLRSRSKSNYLKAGSTMIDDQVEYLKRYNEKYLRREEIYYKLFDKMGNKFNGLVRLTELNETKVFNWESLVFAENCTPMAPIDAMLSIYRIGFEFLGRDQCGPWSVDKKHKEMMKIHEYCKMYSHEFRDDEQYYWIRVGKQKFEAEIGRFRSLGLGDIHY